MSDPESLPSVKAQVKQLAGGLKEVKDVKAVTGIFKGTFGGKTDVKDMLGAVSVSPKGSHQGLQVVASLHLGYFGFIYRTETFWGVQGGPP